MKSQKYQTFGSLASIAFCPPEKYYKDILTLNYFFSSATSILFRYQTKTPIVEVKKHTINYKFLDKYKHIVLDAI